MSRTPLWLCNATGSLRSAASDFAVEKKMLALTVADESQRAAINRGIEIPKSFECLEVFKEARTTVQQIYFLI
jgi:hypothetical protein